jgi:putative endonuclease
MTNKHNTVLYAGVTSNLRRRVCQHKERCVSSFTARHNVDKLVYSEICSDLYNAIAREKQVKEGVETEEGQSDYWGEPDLARPG